jgi:hypothetical protein
MANSTITLQGYDALERKIAQLSTENPGFSKRLRAVIAKVLKEARNEISSRAEQGLQMKSDPRHAYRAVRYAVYKRIFGGQLNILQSRRAGASTTYSPPRTLKAERRGGNRRLRTSRNLDKYEGVDRGFILRWLNNGMTKTNPRTIHFTENPKRKVDKWNKHPNTGNRGAIAARNWFRGASLQELQSVAGEMQQLIDNVIKDEFV